MSPITESAQGDSRRLTADTPPYLSFVVASRNDDHGGNMTRRMQMFVDCLCDQCARHGLRAELLLVEWNPPADRPPLASALTIPGERMCPVRILTVPAEVHRRYRHADRLPLFQMIAKNVGIRAAKGRFVLATNVDILFSEELIAHLAGEPLRAGESYRLDRYDVDNAVMHEKSTAEALDFCARNILRVHAADGTFATERDGRRSDAGGTAASFAPALRFRHGWHSPELDSRGRPFRWMANEGCLDIGPSPVVPPPTALRLDLQPGPSLPWPGTSLQVLDDATGEEIYAGHMSGPCSLTVALPRTQAENVTLRLRLGAAPVAVPLEPRCLMLRLTEAGLVSAGGLEMGISPRPGGRWLRLKNRAIRSRWLRWLKYGFFCRHRRTLRGAQMAADSDMAALTQPLARLHINACGDFTLLAKADWERVCGYAELDAHSFNLDSLLLYVAHFSGIREVVWSDLRRIYHVEHAETWNPETAGRRRESLLRQGIAVLTTAELMTLAKWMEKWNCPLITHPHTWGRAGGAFAGERESPAHPRDQV